MKYFTPDLWLGWHDEDNSARRQATEQFHRNGDEYLLQLRDVLPRLDKADQDFFENTNLHDGRLVAFIAGDEIDFNIAEAEAFDINSHKTSVRLTVLGPWIDELFTLEYSGVRRAVFDYPTDDPLFHAEGCHLGDWGYDELTAVDDTYLRHEILFASGSSILIEFKKFSHSRQEVNGSRYKH